MSGHRVLFLHKWFDLAGGVERVQRNLAATLHSAGVQTSFYVLDTDGDKRAGFEQLAAEFDAVAPPATSGRGGRVRHLFQHVATREITAIIATTETANLFAFFCSLRFPGLRVIYSRHSPLDVSEQKLSPLAVKCLYNLYAMSGGELVTVSERLRGELQRALLGRRPVHLIANAVLGQRVLELAESGADDGVAGDYFCAVGRLVPVKGFDLLLQAYAQARQQRSGLPDLLIVGEGEQREQLQALAAALGIAGAVRFHGYTTNPYYLMKRARVFVLSSRHEGMPTVLIEAMALGTPVISFDCTSGPAELIGDPSRGLLVPAEDVDALAAALVRYDSVPAADASAVERFRFERAAEAYLQLLAA